MKFIVALAFSSPLLTTAEDIIGKHTKFPSDHSLRAPATSKRLLRGGTNSAIIASRTLEDAVGGENDPIKVGEEYGTHISNEDDSVVLPTLSDLQKTAKWKVKKTGASYMALHFSNFDLEDGCEVTVSGKNKKDGYKMTGKGKMNSGTFWAQHVKEDDITVSCHCKGGPAQRMCHFNIDSYAAGYPNEQASGVFNRARELFPKVSRREAQCGSDDKTLAVCNQISHPTKYAKSRPVARLLMNGSGACTGWLASDNNHLITNEHCIGSAATALDTDFEFMAEAPNCGDPDGWMNHPGQQIVSGADLIKLNANLDYALVQINSGNPASTFGHMVIDNRAAVVNEEIYIPQHAGGRSKQLGYESTHSSDGGVCHVNGFTPPCGGSGYNDVGYYCDTEGGSSGSPVLSAGNKVIALHHCGGCMNQGVPINLVCNDIGQDAPEVCAGTTPLTPPPVAPNPSPVAPTPPPVAPTPPPVAPTPPPVAPTTTTTTTTTTTVPPLNCGEDSTFEIDILTDNYPTETTWTLTNTCDDSEVASGGPYNNQGTLYSERICVPTDAEYSLVMNDEYGDGICCGEGQGSYDVTYNGEAVVSGGGEFGSSEIKTFGAGYCPPPPPPTPPLPPSSGVAEYDSLLGAPKCTSVGSSCTSGDLLDGKASNKEPNPPNTLDSCTDGAYGSYHADESIDKITVSAVGGGQLQAGGLAEIEAKVWAWSNGAGDTADIYYTDNVNSSPTWTLIGSLPAGGSGLRSLKIQYLLSDSSMQAVRVNFRYFGSQSSCSGGTYDDVDDLVFAVAPSVEGAKETRKPKPVPELKPKQSSHCAMIGDKGRCGEASVCKWQNANGIGEGKGCYPN